MYPIDAALKELQEKITPISALNKYRVYALWDNGKIVYIGQSEHLYSRLYAHAQSKKFDGFSYIDCESQSMMDLVELCLIIMLKPQYNATMLNEYETLTTFRKRIRSISDCHKYSNNFHLPKIKETLIENNIEIIGSGKSASIMIENIPSALACVLATSP